MTTQDDFDRFVAMQRGVRARALRELVKWWASVAHLPQDEVIAAANDYVPALAQTFGELSATAAAQFYDDARADAGPLSRFTAGMAPSGAADQARAEMGWAWPKLQSDPLDALDRLSGVVDAAALQDGRSTIVYNSERDRSHPSWSRVPVGNTCAWCLMLASRGAVYWTAATAGANKKFHRQCDCQPVPSWIPDESDLPPSYKKDELYDLYRRAREDAGSGNPKAIMRALRRLDGGVHVSDGVPN